MLTTHDVPCPRCGRTPESPKIEHDERGYFMRCRSCASRIAMRRLERDGAAAWRPAA
jgi:translation initiation factor 2 beta subunit (eIF-2beta)/eIF-5